MEPTNAEIVRGIYGRWGEGDFRGAVEFFDPYVLLVMGPEFPDSGTYLGIEGVARYTRGFLEPWSHIVIEADEIIESGDTVVVAVRQSGEGMESGAATEFRYFHLWSFRGGRVIRFETIRERGDALAAAGLGA